MTHKGGRQLWPSRLKSGDLAQVVGVQLFATASAVGSCPFSASPRRASSATLLRGVSLDATLRRVGRNE